MMYHCVWVAIVGFAVSEAKVSEILAFGNSLTDDGINFASGDRHGFVKYSNGPIWTDYLALRFRSPDGKLPNIMNYAYSGAKSSYDNYYFTGWSGTLWQIDRYLNQTPAGVPGDTLVVLELGGGNDIFDGADVSKSVIQNGLAAVRKLLNAGAKQLLVQDLVDMSAMPYFQAIPAQGLLVSAMIKKINKGIRDGLVNSSSVVLVNSSIALERIQRTFSVLDQPFTHHRNDTAEGDIQAYAWFDTFHPSSGAHSIIASVSYETWTKARGSNDEIVEEQQGEIKGVSGVFKDLFEQLVDGFFKLKDTITKNRNH